MNDIEKTFIELYEEEIKNHIDYDATEEETIQNIYDSDMNFKHADPTTNMRVHSEYDIKILLESGIKWLSNQENRCSGCARVIKEDDYEYTTESRGEYWGAPCSETVCIGYWCSNCDEKELF